MKYVIEKGLPIGSRNRAFPFDEMEVGDSILVQSPESKSARRRAMSLNKKKTPDTPWVTRTIEATEPSLGGIRIWRTK